MSDIPQGIQLTPFDPVFERDPYAVYAKLREAAPVHFDGTTYVVSSYQQAASLLKDRRLTVDPRKVGQVRDPRADNEVTRRDPGMMNLDDPEHARLRALVNRAFTSSSVSAFRQQVVSIASTLVQAFTPEMDVINGYAGPLSTITIAEFMGIEANRHREFKQWTDTLSLQGYPMPTAEQWEDIVEADAAMREAVRGVIRERRAARRDDLVSRLLDASASDDEVVDLCTLLVGAGNFTTTDLMGHALLRFSEADRRRIPSFVEETLQLDPPSQSVRRWALEDIQAGEVRIKAGSPVMLLIGAANHDPDAGPHLSFGRGIHHCLGASLARMETEVALEMMPRYRVVSFKRRKSMMFRGCSSIRVELV